MSSSVVPSKTISHVDLLLTRLANYAETLDQATHASSIQPLMESSIYAAADLRKLHDMFARQDTSAPSVHEECLPVQEELRAGIASVLPVGVEAESVFPPLRLPSPPSSCVARSYTHRQPFPASPCFLAVPSSAPADTDLLPTWGRYTPSSNLTVSPKCETTTSIITKDGLDQKLTSATEKLNDFSRLLNSLPEHFGTFRLGGRSRMSTSREDEIPFWGIGRAGKELKSAILALVEESESDGTDDMRS